MSRKPKDEPEIAELEELPEPDAKWRAAIDNDLDKLCKSIDRLAHNLSDLKSQLEADRASARVAEKDNQTAHREIRSDLKCHLKRIVSYEREARVAMDRSACEPVPLRRTV